MSNIPVALIQLTAYDSPQSAREAYAESILDAANQSAELIVLPELHNYPYFPQIENIDFFDLAEPIPGPSTQFFSKLAKQLKVVIVTSLFEKRAKGLYHNTAVVLDKDGSIAGRYRKMHIPDDPGFYEKYYFTPGDIGFEPITTSVGKLGVLICWDQWFPEAARLMALKGADCLLYPTAIGLQSFDDPETQESQLNAWKTIQQSHAIANGLPVACCNRVGLEKIEGADPDGTRFWGHSFVTNANGNIIGEANSEKQILFAQLEKSQIEPQRRAWPFLRDRRIEHYTALDKILIESEIG